MSSHQFTRPEGTGGKSILGSDDKTPLNQLEKKALSSNIINGFALSAFNWATHHSFPGLVHITI